MGGHLRANHRCCHMSGSCTSGIRMPGVPEEEEAEGLGVGVHLRLLLIVLHRMNSGGMVKEEDGTLIVVAQARDNGEAEAVGAVDMMIEAQDFMMTTVAVLALVGEVGGVDIAEMDIGGVS